MWVDEILLVRGNDGLGVLVSGEGLETGEGGFS